MNKSTAKIKKKIPTDSIQSLTKEIQDLKEMLREEKLKEESLEESLNNNNPEEMLKDSLNVFKLIPKDDLKRFDWEGKNLRGANFENLDLSGFSFKGSSLHYANFNNCILNDTIFFGCDLSDCDFSGASFSKSTNFKKTITKNTIFSLDSIVEVEMLGVKGDYIIDDGVDYYSYKQLKHKANMTLTNLVDKLNNIIAHNEKLKITQEKNKKLDPKDLFFSKKDDLEKVYLERKLRYEKKITAHLKKELAFLKKWKRGLPKSMGLNNKIEKALNLVQESKKSSPSSWSKNIFRP